MHVRKSADWRDLEENIIMIPQRKIVLGEKNPSWVLSADPSWKLLGRGVLP